MIYRTNHERGFGFVNWDGEILTEQIYSAVYSTAPKIGAIVVSIGRKRWFVVDRFGNPIEIEVKGTISQLFSDRYVVFGDGAGVYDFFAKEVIIPPVYDYILTYNEGFFMLAKMAKMDLSIHKGISLLNLFMMS